MPDENVQMRCPGTLQAILCANGLIEIKCHHIRCTKGRAATVFHYYSPDTGDLMDTVVFQDPERKFKR